jgi:hypothetical protein
MLLTQDARHDMQRSLYATSRAIRLWGLEHLTKTLHQVESVLQFDLALRVTFFSSIKSVGVLNSLGGFSHQRHQFHGEQRKKYARSSAKFCGFGLHY